MQELQEAWVQSLGREDPLEEEMATHTSVPAWRVPWRKEPGRLQSWSHRESDTAEWACIHPLFMQLVRMERTSEVIESPPHSLVSWSSSGGETEPHRWSESQIHARRVPGWGLTPVKHSDVGTEMILREQGWPDWQRWCPTLPCCQGGEWIALYIMNLKW